MKIAASTQKYKSSPTKASQLWSWMALKNRAFHWLSSTSMATRLSSMAITLPSRTRPAQRSSERKYGKARPQMVPSVVKKPLTGCSCRVDRVCRGLLIRISRAELRHHGQVTPQASSRSPSESEGVRDPERHATAEARKSRPESPAVTVLVARMERPQSACEIRARPFPDYVVLRATPSGLQGNWSFRSAQRKGAASPRPRIAILLSGLQ